MLAIAGGKGGVGKTTTALGIARAWARQRRRPLVVEADTDMPDLAAVTGVPVEPGIDTVATGADVDRVAHPEPAGTGVGVVPAAPGANVGPALDRLTTDRPVVLDCPAGASDAAVTPMMAADRILVVTTPDEAAIRDTVKTAELARAVDTPVVGVVLTRTETAPDGLSNVVGSPVEATVPAVAPPPLTASAVRATYDRLAAHLRGKD
ncbi:MAG: MinD/ParA family protein [Halobacteriaceae archaeon]